ncbi:hypothetical protein HPB47_027739 [Ixodes persulcatus]|uniref:Uncharacterized protein n=1 Tax=Ixodes persulcatus TaxID=34615 RepID=A0AC60PV64_IXOPE|nr:hypothetical protein HPB47_027739 [Ixodes persulcatus]
MLGAELSPELPSSDSPFGSSEDCPSVKPEDAASTSSNETTRGHGHEECEQRRSRRYTTTGTPGPAPASILSKSTMECSTVFQFESGGDGRDVLTEGHHEFNFSFLLPTSGVTTSFEGKYGSVRYWLKAEVEKPWSFNHKTKKAFTVISPIDINRNEYLVRCPIQFDCLSLRLASSDVH